MSRSAGPLIAIAVALVVTMGRSVLPVEAVSRLTQTQTKTKTEPANDAAVARQICTPCHKLPPPDILPRAVWRSEIAKMMFIAERQPAPADLNGVALSGDMAAALRYFETHAPDRLPAPERWPDPDESPVKFTSYGLSVPDLPNDPVVSNVALADVDGDGKVDVIGTEMKQGTVFW